MKRNETRWYILWFVGSGMWLITFIGNFSSGHMDHWIILMQFLNIWLYLAAGIVNRNQYKKRNRKDK